MIFILLMMNIAMGFDLKPIHNDITEHFRVRLDKLQTVETWSQFIKENPKIFPPLSATDAPATVVMSEEIKVKDETFTIGIGHRQSFVKTDIENYKTFLNSPQLFEYAYGLDGPTKVNEPHEGAFMARLQKKVPGIEDQDFTLSYVSSSTEKFHFIRAKMVEDKKNFALRDNLKVLEKTPDGVIAREITIVYPLRWWVRAMSGTMRKLMKEEMTKVGRAEKCILESDKETALLPETAKSCWQKSQK